MQNRIYACARLAVLTFAWLQSAHAAASSAVVGVNLVNEPYKQTPEEQEATLNALQSAGVTAIRASIPNDDSGVAFAQRVNAHGIRIEWLVYLSYKPGTVWPKPPHGHENMWHYPGLSATDPDAFSAAFGSQLAKLESKGIEFAAFELGNEINWTAFNADFPIPGEGKIFGLDDLNNDPEAQKVAQGFVQYLKSLAVLKEIRDHSKLNQHTPVISAGLAIGNNTPGRSWDRELDGVSINATLDYMRAHGLDNVVDGYGVHTYPPRDKPGTREGADMRASRLERIVVTECRPPGNPQGKPCWLTEWGFPLPHASCPSDDHERTLLVQEMIGNFKRLADQGRLQGAFYFQWQGHIHAPKEDNSSLFICGKVGEAGRLVVHPF